LTVNVVALLGCDSTQSDGNTPKILRREFLSPDSGYILKLKIKTILFFENW